MQQRTHINITGPLISTYCALHFFVFFHFLILRCFFFVFSFFIFCKNGKPRKTCKCALCTVDDTCCFHDIRLGPKTSVYHMKVSVVSTAAGCDVTNCATRLQGFNKHFIF